MRALRKLFSMAALLAVVALMGLPAVASAAGTSNRAWIDSGDFLGDGGGDYDRHVVLEVSGDLNLYHSSGFLLNCEVTGEIEVWNDWQGDDPTWLYKEPGSLLDTPARNAVTSLQIAGTPASACDVSGTSQLASVSYTGLPWAGQTVAGQPNNAKSTFSGVNIGWSWQGGGSAGVSGAIQTRPQGSGCIGGFDIVQAYVGNTLFLASGELEIDDVEGLDGGCLLVW